MDVWAGGPRGKAFARAGGGVEGPWERGDGERTGGMGEVVGWVVRGEGMCAGDARAGAVV